MSRATLYRHLGRLRVVFVRAACTRRSAGAGGLDNRTAHRIQGPDQCADGAHSLGPSMFARAEFLILLYYAERTLVYGKRSDASILSPATRGIFSRTKREWIRGPAGLSACAVKQANKSLTAQGVLFCRRAIPGESRYRPDRGFEATEYEINWTVLCRVRNEKVRTPWSPSGQAPWSPRSRPLGRLVPNNRGKSSSEETYDRKRLSEDRSAVEEELRSTAAKRGTGRQSASEGNDEKSAAPRSFGSSKEELAYWCSNRGQLLSQGEWQGISAQLELRGIDQNEFVAFLRPHLANPKTNNPLGMIKSKIKAYRTLNRPAVPPAAPSQPESTVAVEKCLVRPS